MAIEGGRFWFKSSLFDIEPGEDEEINPRLYGKQLAKWLADKLRGCGYEPTVINEDWGRCIMCKRDPVWLWVGCGNVDLDFPERPMTPPNKEEIVWHCFVICQIPFWKRLFKKVNGEPFVQKLTDQLSSILRAESQIEFVEEQDLD
jgi:hypothetical protein